MTKLPHSKALLAVTVIQSILTALGWALYYAMFLFLGPGIDFDKPDHQITTAQRLGEATLVMGLPLLWSSVGAVLLWLRSAVGWWVCILGDLIVAFWGMVLVIADTNQIPEIRKHPALYSDVVYHSTLLLLPAAALLLLFSRSIRPYASGWLVRTDTPQ